MQIAPLQVHPVAPSAAQPSMPELRAENQKLIQAVKALNATELFGQNSELTFVMDRKTHRPLVRIIDRKTGKVIRQIPPEYVVRMSEDLKL